MSIEDANKARFERGLTVLTELESELLEALEELVLKVTIERNWHSARGGDDYPESTEIKSANKAIAKAHGETP